MLQYHPPISDKQRDIGRTRTIFQLEPMIVLPGPTGLAGGCKPKAVRVRRLAPLSHKRTHTPKLSNKHFLSTLSSISRATARTARGSAGARAPPRGGKSRGSTRACLLTSQGSLLRGARPFHPHGSHASIGHSSPLRVRCFALAWCLLNVPRVHAPRPRIINLSSRPLSVSRPPRRTLPLVAVTVAARDMRCIRLRRG